MEASEQKKKQQKRKDDLELKLEEFYSSLEEDEKLEKLEDIRRLARESKELLRKVDALVELLLKAAQEPDTEDSEVLLHVQKVSDDLEEVLTKLKVLDELKDAVSKDPELLSQLSAQISEINASISALSEELKAKLSVLPSISEKMDTLGNTLSGVDEQTKSLSSTIADLREDISAISEIREKIAALQGVADKLPDSVAEDVEDKLKILDSRLDSVVSSIGGLSTKLDSIDSAIRDLLKIQSRLDVLEEIERSVKASPDQVSSAVVSAMESELSTLKKQLEDLSGKVSESSSTAALIRTDLEPISEKLDALEAELKSLKSLKALQKHVDQSIASAKSEILSSVSAGDEQILKKLEELERLADSLDEVKTYIKRQYEENEWNAQHFAELEKELAALNLAIDSVHKLLDGDISSRKEALSALSERVNKILEQLAVANTHADGATAQRISELQESLRSISQQIADAYEKILDAESKNSALFEALLKEFDEKISALESEVSKDTSKATVVAVRKELDEISQQLTNLTDMMVQDHGLLSKHSANVADILTRVQLLQARLDDLAGAGEAVKDLSERQKAVEQLLEEMHKSIKSMSRDVRNLKASDVHKKLDELKTSLSVINSELMGVMELMKRYDVSAQLEKITKALAQLSEAVEQDRMSKEQATAEIARLEEELAQITQLLSAADVEHLKNRLETIHADVLAVHDRIKSARAILDEKELKDLIKDLEAMRASVRQLRDYGLSDEIDEIHAKLRKLKEELSKHAEAVQSGGVHHASVKEKHAAVMRVAKPLLDTSAMVAAVATVHGSHAKTIKSHARKLAKHTGSVHAHLIAAHADRIEKTAKAMKDIEKLAKKVDSALQKTDRAIDKKRGVLSAKLASADPEQAALRQVVKYVAHMRKGDRITVRELSEELGIRQDILARVLEKIAASGERRLRLKKPVLGVFGEYVLEKY
ncbi:MAG: hypothetical protein GXN93_03070 [Candidatus Diapherotrites archaeon]|nr:hypothetical protein [Candidatus Diapherotrites archaeon]